MSHKNHRHSGEGRSPAPSVREAHDSYLPQMRRHWIPAFAGMTIVLMAMFLFVPTANAKAKAEPQILIPPVPPVVLTYDVYVGGVHLVTANIAFQEKGSSYKARVFGKSYGIWYKLFPWDTELRVNGKIRADKFVPVEFYTHDVWGKKAKTTWLHFRKNGDVDPAFDPPNTDKNREDVPQSLRHGTLDPITGLLDMLAQVAVHNSCVTTVPIFEGKRRFDITGIDTGTEYIDNEDYSVFKGDARTCDATFEMVAGEWKDRAPDRFWTRNDKEAGREPFHIWLGSIALNMPEQAVRLESGSVWGLIVMHLSSWHYATPDEVSF